MAAFLHVALGLETQWIYKISQTGTRTSPWHACEKWLLIIFNYFSLSQPAAPKVKNDCPAIIFHFLAGRQLFFTQIPIWSEAGNYFSLWPGQPGWAVGGPRLGNSYRQIPTGKSSVGESLWGNPDVGGRRLPRTAKSTRPR